MIMIMYIAFVFIGLLVSIASPSSPLIPSTTTSSSSSSSLATITLLSPPPPPPPSPPPPPPPPPPLPPPLTPEELEEVAEAENRLRVSGSLAFISLLAVLSTLLYWPKIYIGKPFIVLIFWTSTFDFIASCAILLGYPSGPLCEIQGFMLFLFYRTSWLLQALLSIELMGVVVFRRLFLIGKGFIKTLVIVFLCNIFLSCLPFITQDSYGLNARLQGTYSCGIEHNNYKDGIKWTIVLNTVPLFIALVIMFIMIIITTVQYYRIPYDDPFKRKLLTCVFTINLYLWAMFIFWLPNIAVNMYCATTNNNNNNATTTKCLKYLDRSISIVPYQGVCMSIIYFWRTAEPKRLLYKVLIKYICKSWKDIDFITDGSEMHHDTNNDDETVNRITIDGQFFMIFNRSSALRIDNPQHLSANRIPDTSTIELQVSNPINSTSRETIQI